MIRRIPVPAALAALALAAAFTPAADARKAPPVFVDPACLASVPWLVNPAEADLLLIGCRPLGQVSAPDAEGWRRFDSPDGGTTEVHRDVLWNPRSRGITFRLRYNGGGSLTSVYTITGRPVVKGRLKAGSFTVQ